MYQYLDSASRANILINQSDVNVVNGNGVECVASSEPNWQIFVCFVRNLDVSCSGCCLPNCLQQTNTSGNRSWIIVYCVKCVHCILLFMYIVHFSYNVAFTAKCLVPKNFTTSTLVYMMCDNKEI